MAWIDSLFNLMIEKDASDLHMTSGRKPMLRVHGDMETIADCAEIAAEQMAGILFEITPESNKVQFEGEHDTDFAYELEDGTRFRANLFWDNRGPGAVFRVIPSKILSAEQLNLPRAVTDFCFLSKGLVVVTGPTGSGKSTTLAAMIDLINQTRSDHIITVEDPIEFVHPDKQCLVNQREVGRHTDSFKRALRAALREDPDIVLVGEMRDLETIETAIETAETGHLVFGTLHTTTAASTVDRIIDQFPANQQGQIRTMLSTSLKGVVAQNLLKKKGGGRCAALEILVVTSAISSQIRDGKTYQISSTMQTGVKHGMKLLNDSLLELVVADTVEPGEAYIKAIDKIDLMTKFQQSGVKFDPNSLVTQRVPTPVAAPATAAKPSPAPAKPAPGRPAPASMAPAELTLAQPASKPASTNPARVDPNPVASRPTSDDQPASPLPSGTAESAPAALSGPAPVPAASEGPPPATPAAAEDAAKSADDAADPFEAFRSRRR